MTVTEQVLRRLGTPPGFFRADARTVGDNTYRVNIFVHADVGLTIKSGRIAHSFFVTVEGGEIVRSSPPIPEHLYPVVKPRASSPQLELQGVALSEA